MKRLKVLAILSVVFAVVMAAAVVSAQTADEPVKKQTQVRAGQGNGPNQGGTGDARTARRRLGPGDGTGNQGAKPQDGTGYGSPFAGGATGNTLGGQSTGTGTGAKKGKAYGPGDGTGNQGMGPRDGSGYGPATGGCTGTGPTSPRAGGRGGRR